VFNSFDKSEILIFCLANLVCRSCGILFYPGSVVSIDSSQNFSRFGFKQVDFTRNCFLTVIIFDRIHKNENIVAFCVSCFLCFVREKNSD